MFGRNASTGVSGNEQSGLFTAAGRDRLGPDNTHRGGRNGGGPVRDGSRRRGGSTGSGRRPGGLRGTSSVLPDVRRVRSSDQDGDMDMGGEKKKNFSPYQRPGRGPRSSTNSSPGTTTSGNFVVFVTGPGIGTDASLFDFLNRKTSPVKLNVSNKRPGADGSTISFEVPTAAQARVLKGLNGIRYKQKKLIIKTTGDFSAMEESTDSASRSAATTSSGTIDSIRSFIRSRYSNGFLNLENMAADEILRSASIYPPGRRTGRSDVGPVMMKVAAELFPETTTISFNSNSLRSLQPISSVAQFFPNIQNLSFKNNEIRDYKDLEYLSGNKKLPNLRELILLENPLRDRILSKEKDDISYRSMVTKLFPSIQMLDQSPVAPKISFGLGDIVKEAAEKSALPVSIRGNFFDSPGTQAMAFEFLTSFFKLFDTNRSALEHMYDNSATFSYTTMVNISPLQKSLGKPGDNWNEYKFSRNLSRLGDLTQRTNRIHVGNSSIVKHGLIPLPETRHDLSNAAKFSVDAWQTGGLLPAICIYIMVHGEFEQVNSNRPLRKSFDRSFIIAPAPPSSQAAIHGWKCLIISDQLTIRQYNGSDAWKPEPDATPAPVALVAPIPGALPPTAIAPVAAPAVVATPASNTGVAAQQVPMPGISPEQHAKAIELQGRTGLTYPYAVQCLSAVGWDIQAGITLVEQERANIPADAWQQPPAQF